MGHLPGYNLGELLPRFLRNSYNGWKYRGDIFEGLAIMERLPVILRFETTHYSAETLTTYLPWESRGLLSLSPGITCSVPLSHTCCSQRIDHPFSSLLLYPNGTNLTGNILMPDSNKLSLWLPHLCKNIILSMGCLLLQPHLLVFCSAFNHALYNSEMYVISACCWVNAY